MVTYLFEDPLFPDICGVPRLHLHSVDETVGASTEVRVEFRLGACLSVGKLKGRACLKEGRF